MINGERVWAMLQHTNAVMEDRIAGETAESDRQQIVVRCVLDRMRSMARASILWALHTQEYLDTIGRVSDQLADSKEQNQTLQSQNQALQGQNQTLQSQNQTLQGQNQTLQKEVDALRVLAAQLKAILRSRAFRLAQAFRTIRLFLIPQDSLRERFVVVALRALRRIRCGSEDIVSPVLSPISPPVSPPVSPSTSSAASLESMGQTPAAPALPACTAAVSPKPVNQVVVNSKELDFSKEELDWLTQDRAAEMAYAPLSWPLKAETQSNTRFIDLVILSPVHRSGSTLLQRICNSRKGTLIWGEHGGLLAHFANIYASAAYFSTAGSQERVDYFGQGENPNLWIADMCPDLDYVQMAVVDSARAFLKTFYGQYREQHDILGFKEVHYRREELDLIRACCPETEIVFLVRNPLDTWKSTPRRLVPLARRMDRQYGRRTFDTS